MRCPNPAKTVAETRSPRQSTADNQANQNARRCLRLDNRLPRQSIKPKRKALPKGIPINSTPKPSKDRRRKQDPVATSSSGRPQWPFNQGWPSPMASLSIKFGLQMASFAESRIKNLSVAGQAIFYQSLSQPAAGARGKVATASCLTPCRPAQASNRCVASARVSL